MKSGQTRLVASKATALVLIVQLAFLACRPSEATGPGGTYEISDDPADEVLTLRVAGGYGSGSPQYHLYGDGRLVREARSRGTQQPPVNDQRFISSEDIALLFDLAVQSGLIELTRDQLISAIGKGAAEGPVDGSQLMLTMRLTQYVDTSGQELTPFHATVVMPAYPLLAHTHPDVAQIAAMMSIHEALSDYFGAIVE